jgi:hypothetical protein
MMANDKQFLHAWIIEKFRIMIAVQLKATDLTSKCNFTSLNRNYSQAVPPPLL